MEGLVKTRHKVNTVKFSERVRERQRVATHVPENLQRRSRLAIWNGLRWKMKCMNFFDYMTSEQ